MAPPRRLRRQNPKIGEDCEFQRTDIFRHFIRLAGRFSEIWHSIKKISKNRSYTLKILEFHVESPEGNKIKEIPNFKETSFFDMSSRIPNRIPNRIPIELTPKRIRIESESNRIEIVPTKSKSNPTETESKSTKSESQPNPVEPNPNQI